MLRATVNRVRRQDGNRANPTTPNWFRVRLIPYLQSISKRANTHPIHTIAFFAILASTTYIALLESSLFEPPAHVDAVPGQVDVPSFLAGSKTLLAGKNTDWKWQNAPEDAFDVDQKSSTHSSVLTLVFPDHSDSDGIQVGIPRQASIASLANSSAELLPPSKNLLSPISSDTTVTFSVPFHSTQDFLDSVHQLPSRKTFTYAGDVQDSVNEAEPQWIMTAMRSPASSGQRSFKRRVGDAWSAFTDVLKNAEELDVVIMVLGYLSMHLTFVSLFMSLRRLGSHFWLGTTVLFSSAFALLFGLIVTIKLGVPLNMVLLSEGLPFLVVTVGFEKPIILTKAVLQASVALKRASTRDSNTGDPSSTTRASSSTSNIQSSVQIAVREKGYEIVRDYALEILILIAGAASGVQGGLCQFCFLAAWILFFDCILLFTFYTAILTIKLEINRIRRHVALRRALEEDGVSHRVAATVASSDEWPNITEVDHVGPSHTSETSVFGMKARDSSVSKFKVLMVGGFIAINLLNFATIPFRKSARTAGSALSSAVTQPPMDPFKVAGNGLDKLLSSAKRSQRATTVTVFTPIKYELADVLYEDGNSYFGSDFADSLFNGMGGRVFESILKSFEDPLLSKWIIIALVISLILNGYLFNAARWTINNATQLRPGPTLPTSEPNRAKAEHSVPPTVEVSASSKQLDSPEPSQDVTIRSSAGTKLPRSTEDCEVMLKEKRAPELNDDELISLTVRGKIPGYALEKTLGDKTRAVKIRRGLVSRTPATSEHSYLLENSLLPYQHYDYDRVFGACCENVIGYLPLPLGVAGPMVIDGKSYYLPMATTEGVLVASTSRGAKAINAGGGCITAVTGDGMTRGPCVGFNSLSRAGQAKVWLDSEDGQRIMKDAFNSTSRFARLQSLKSTLAGTYLYIRFKTTTGDAMGMNMISKGVEKALEIMSNDCGFDDMAIISVSGNYCTDKKPAAINWIDGRGKSVVAEAIIPGEVVRNVLKSDVDALVELNMAKNLIGSAMAGSIGGFNAHAANIVAAIFLATGQDPAQVVESSHCIDVMRNHHGNLQISVSMPCMEVGTIGGGTFLGPQSAVLDMLGVRGAHATNPGDNARQLARVIVAAVLAGELSLCSALAAGHLVRAHMQHNRSAVPTRASTPTPKETTGTPTAASLSPSAALSSSSGVAGARR